MQSETGFPSSHQLKSYVASKSRLKLAARAVLSADAGLLVLLSIYAILSNILIVFNVCMFLLSCNCVLIVVNYTDMLLHESLSGTASQQLKSRSTLQLNDGTNCSRAVGSRRSYDL